MQRGDKELPHDRVWLHTFADLVTIKSWHFCIVRQPITRFFVFESFPLTQRCSTLIPVKWSNPVGSTVTAPLISSLASVFGTIPNSVGTLLKGLSSNNSPQAGFPLQLHLAYFLLPAFCMAPSEVLLKTVWQFREWTNNSWKLWRD
jgi:hypothetical protein